MARPTREFVLDLRARGYSGVAIAKTLGITKSTVSYHLRRAGEAPDARYNRRYDWAEVQRYYDAGHSISDCQRQFGFARETWNDARRRGDVVSRPAAMPLEKLLGEARNRGHIKLRLVRLGLKEDRCERCGLSDWLDRRLALALHHINGDGKDHRLENLQILCPNCHSQTDNFAGRNRGRVRTLSPPPS